MNPLRKLFQRLQQIISADYSQEQKENAQEKVQDFVQKIRNVGKDNL